MLARPLLIWRSKMLVKNISARLHHVGDASIIPGQTAEVDDMWRGSLNPNDLVVIEEAPVAAKPAVAPAASKTVAPLPGAKAVPKAAE